MYPSERKIPHGRLKQGHWPDDAAPPLIQDSRLLKSEIGFQLSHDTKASINHVFSKAHSNPKVYNLVLQFIDQQIPLIDINLNQLSASLSADAIRIRLRANLSDHHLDQWVDYSLSKKQDADFSKMIEKISRCVGGARISQSLLRSQTAYNLFTQFMSVKPDKEMAWLVSVMEGSQDSPSMAAELVYEFFQAVRDLGEPSAKEAFFEGFSFEAGLAVKGGPGLKASWLAAPMLKALVKAKQEVLAARCEEFIRIYLRNQRQSNDKAVGGWQREYDQHFQMLLNLQSGMFFPGAHYGYGVSDSGTSSAL